MFFFQILLNHIIIKIDINVMLCLVGTYSEIKANNKDFSN